MFDGVFLQHWWQPSSVTSVICCVKAGRVTVSWLLLSSSHHRLTSQLLLNMEPSRFLPRVSTLLMRAVLKVTASWRREVELEAAGRLVGQLFRHSDYQLGFDSEIGPHIFSLNFPFFPFSSRSVDFIPYLIKHFPVSMHVIFKFKTLTDICVYVPGITSKEMVKN